MLKTRNSSDVNVEKITNGFIVTLTGRDDNNNYLTDKSFVKDLNEVKAQLEAYFKLKED
jgi:hypothetical protein